MKPQSKLSDSGVVISLLFFTLLWAGVTDAWGTSTIIFGADKTAWQKLSYDIGCRIIWVLPVFYLLRRYVNDLPTAPRAMLRNKPDRATLIVFIIVFTVYGIAVMLIGHGGFRINTSLHLVRSVLLYLTVAVVEELVYRGWALNALSRFLSERRAVVVSALFFVVLHWPAYMIKFFLTGSFALSQLVMQSAVVLVIGLLMGHVFVKSKSIAAPIILHMYFDLIVNLLAG